MSKEEKKKLNEATHEILTILDKENDEYKKEFLEDLMDLLEVSFW